MALADEWNPLTITSPSPNQNLRGAREVVIRWEHMLGGDVQSSIVYSTDGKVFDRAIASKLDSCQYTWKTAGMMYPAVWIKVKLYRQGYLLAESVTPVRFLPSTAIIVSKCNQKVFHFVDGSLKSVYTCSTALPKYDLAPGDYKVYLRVVKHWSREYEVWMPHALFFHNGYAVHATNMIRQLGRPASHGCIRLHPRDARQLFDRVPVGTPVIVLAKTTDCSALLSLRKVEQVAARPTKPQPLLPQPAVLSPPVSAALGGSTAPGP